jgi:hypothetical protein
LPLILLGKQAALFARGATLGRWFKTWTLAQELQLKPTRRCVRKVDKIHSPGERAETTRIMRPKRGVYSTCHPLGYSELRKYELPTLIGAQAVAVIHHAATFSLGYSSGEKVKKFFV